MSDETLENSIRSALARLPADQAQVNALTDLRDLGRKYKQLVSLVRIGFLVRVNGERATVDIVREPETRRLLMTILQAKDTEAAVSASQNKKG